jgi:hypothetical protein
MMRSIYMMVIGWMGICPVFGVEDLLRFTNGDQLHGEYRGIGEGPSILWDRDDVGEAVEFKMTDIRHVVLNAGEVGLKSSGMAHVGTVNGDRIPGEVVELGEKNFIVQTTFGGLVEIPREQVELIAPNPLGGRILYHGPFEKESWKMVNSENAEGLPDAKADEKDELADERWKFSGSAWYWDHKGFGTGLVRDEGMSDQSVIKFEAAWKGRLSLAVGFHADFAKPEKADVDGEEDDLRQVGRSTVFPGIFGNSYVLHIYSSYVSLYKTSFDEEGRARTDRVHAANSVVRLADSGRASVEIRCHRKTGEIVLFINDQFVCQWTEAMDDELGESEYAGLGNGFGFVVQSDDSPVRISEILISEWNGMPDSARSLQVEEADIVLLANGTDRFSGKVTEISDKRLKIESKFGDFDLPMEEVAEVRFAKASIAEVEDPKSDELKIRFHPLGRISGKPLKGDGGKTSIVHGAIGEVEVNLDSAMMLEVEENGDFIDDWDAEF